MTSLIPRPLTAIASATRSFARAPQSIEPSSLIEIQTESFDWLTTDGLKEVLAEINPIQDVTGNRFELRFSKHEFRTPKHPEDECRERESTFEAPLYVTVELLVKETGEIKEQTLFFFLAPCGLGQERDGL